MSNAFKKTSLLKELTEIMGIKKKDKWFPKNNVPPISNRGNGFKIQFSNTLKAHKNVGFS